MTLKQANSVPGCEVIPWSVEEIDPTVLQSVTDYHVPYPQAIELGVDIIGDPHRENDEGYNWTRLRFARNVKDVIPGSVIIMGSGMGNYLAKVIEWDFEVSDTDPMVTLARIPVDLRSVLQCLIRTRKVVPVAGKIDTVQ